MCARADDQIHQKSCKALWKKREALKPKVRQAARSAACVVALVLSIVGPTSAAHLCNQSARRPLPDAPPDFQELVKRGVSLDQALHQSNEAAFDNYNNKVRRGWTCGCVVCSLSRPRAHVCVCV